MRRGWSGDRHPAADQLDDRLRPRPCPNPGGGRGEVGDDLVHRHDFGETLGRHAETTNPSCAPSRDQHIEQSGNDLLFEQETGREQRVVQLVGIARIGTLFVSHPLDGRLVQHGVSVAGAAGLHRVRSPLFQRRVIEECVRPSVQDFVRERRGLRCIACHALDLAVVNALQDPGQPFEVHRFLQAVAHRLLNQGMLRDLAIAGDVLEARHCVGEDRSHQIVGHRSLQRRGNFAPSAIARDGQGNRGVPPPAGLKNRRVEERLHQHVARGGGMEIAEHVRERKRMLRREREQHCILGRRCLELEIELPAEALSQRQPPRLVDPASERRVEDELHPAGLVEKTLDHQRLLRRDDAEGGA